MRQSVCLNYGLNIEKHMPSATCVEPKASELLFIKVLLASVNTPFQPQLTN